MPFLRAALIRKNLQPEITRAAAVLPPVIEEEIEPEEEFTPVQIEDLHRLIDLRTREDGISEPEIVPDDAEPEEDLTQEETTPPESESLPGLEELEPEIVAPPETDTQEITEPEIVAPPETDTQEVTPPEIVTPPETDTQEITEPEIVAPPETDSQEEITEPEIDSTPDTDTAPDDDFDENDLLNAPSDQDTPPEIEPSEPEPDNDAEAVTAPPTSTKDYSGSQLDYDFTSGERYVDKVSTKTEFDKMLDELAAISKELLSWQADKFARDYTGKFSEGEPTQADARKYEAFLGGYITNAAMMLYDKGYRDAAIKQLEQAISILQARKKLEDETSAIKSRVEEQNDSVDLSDILGLFGDG